MRQLQRIVVLACVVKAGVALAAPTFWPARIGSDGTVIRTPAVRECRVHAVTADGAETLHACGLPVALPSRTLVVWMEQGDWISGQIAPPSGSSAVDLPLVAGGTAQLEIERDQQKQDGSEERRIVRLIHTGAVRFTRTLNVGAAGQRLQMPRGPVLALEMNGHGEVSRVAVGTIVEGRTAEIRPAVPAQGAALVGFFTLPDALPAIEHAATFLVHSPVNGDRVPDLFLEDGSEIVTLWWRVEPGAAELSLRSGGAYQFAAVPIRLHERGVTTVRGELRPLPTLTVKIDVPEGAQEAWQALEPSLTLRRTADKKIVAQSVATDSKEFPMLAVDLYDAVLTAKPWTFVRRADLTGGSDATVEFSVEPFKISGKVVAGTEPKAATITFRRGNGDTTTARAEANGDYEVTLWMSDMYVVEVLLDGSTNQTPFSRATRLSSERRFDIHVPQTSVLVRVTDAVSNEPVANAEVTTFNEWEDAAAGRGRASHTVKTDAHGIAQLAPLTPGTAEIHVKAAGYFKDEPTKIRVTEDGIERTVPVKVRPAGESSALRITLPTGTPAAEAEVMVVGDTAGRQILWSGRADAQGLVKVPRTLYGSIILIRHPAAAGVARRFQDLADQEYQLAPGSPQPLLVKVERHGEPAGSVAMTVWFGGLPLTGGALEFLLQSPAFVSNSGMWKAVNLPRDAVRILASSGMIDAAIAAGAYDALATVVAEPRPNQVVIAVVD